MVRRLLVLGVCCLMAACSPRQQAPVNLPVKTLGGRFYWRDVVIQDGWRIQEHVWTGHCRLLDGRDVRRAWGDRGHCEARLAALRPWPATGRDEHLVVVLPGIGCPRQRLAPLVSALQARGCRVADVAMPSLHVDQDELAAQVAGILAAHRGSRRLSFVTHSMGALVLRRLLDPANAGRADWPAWHDRHDLHRAVLIFPPNRGAAKADAWHGRWWYNAVLGPAGQQLTSAAVQALPPPAVPFAIIAGGRGDGRGRSRFIPGDDDGTVGVAETRLPGAVWHRVVPASHTFGLGHPEVVAAAVDFIDG